MNVKDLAHKAQSFARSPQGRRMINQATDAVLRRSRGKSSGTGRSSGLGGVLDAARRFTEGRGGRRGPSGPAPGAWRR